MAIALTWRNLGALTALVILVLATLTGAVATVVQWQLDAVDKRLSDRMTVYQRDQELLLRALDRVEKRLDQTDQKIDRRR